MGKNFKLLMTFLLCLLGMAAKAQDPVKIGDVGYATLQEAVDAAYDGMTGDVTITIVSDISGYAVVRQKAGLNMTISGGTSIDNAKTINGEILIDGMGHLTSETLTIQYIKFTGDKTNFAPGHDTFITVPSPAQLPSPYTASRLSDAHNITISNCTFTSTSSSFSDIVGFRTASGTQCNTVELINVTGTNLHSLAQLTGTTNATFDGCSATQTGSFINVSGGDGTYTVNNCSFESHPDKTDGYAYREQSSSSAVATLTNNNFKAHDAIILKSAGTINVESGTYEGEITKSAGVLAISGGYFSEEFPQEYIAADLTATGKICVPAPDKEGYYTVGEPAVAKYNNVTYPSLQAALDAAEADDPENIVIDLLDDCTLDITARANVLSIGTSNTQSIVINGGNHTLTFNQKNSDWNDVSTANDAVTKLVLNNMNITNSGYNSGHWKRTNVFFSCNVEMNNVTSTALGFKNDATLNNVTITDNRKDIYGIWITTNGNNVAINGLTLNTTGDGGRGIAIKDEDSQKIDGTSLEIANASFATEKKGAIIVTSSYTVDITAGEGINIANVAKDAENLVWVDEKKAEEFYKVTVTGATVVPETKESDYVAKLIDTDNTILGYYKALDKAITTATAGQTVAILQANTYTLPGISKNITIEGTVDGVVFNHIVANPTNENNIASIPNGATFKNVTFNFGNVNYHGFTHAGTINMEGCTLNGRLTSYGDMNFTDCQFSQSNSDYHMWAYAGNLTYTDCTFTNTVTGKFLNVYNESGATKYTVTVNNCKFVNEASASKAALNVKATSGSNVLAYDVIINDCTTEGSFPEANWGDKLVVLNSVAQVDDRTASGVDNITVTQDGVLIYPVYVAQIGETQYPTLQSALNAAHEMTGDVTVELLKDIKGYSIVHQKAGLNLTIDGKDKTLAGQIFIDGNGRASGTETLTIKNFKFEGNTSNFYSGTDAFILVPSTKDTGKPWSVTNQYNYAHNITVTDCSFTSTSTSDEYDVVCYKATSGAGEYNVTITNCTATGTMMHSLAQLTGTTGGSITNCIVTGSESFVNVSGGTGDFTISGNTFTSAEDASGYGIRENGTSDAVITLTDNTFTAANAVVLGKGTNVTAGTINVVSGIYNGDITKTDAATGKIVISGGRFSAPLGNSAYAQFIAEGLYGVNGIYPDTPDTPNGIGDAVATVTKGETVTNYASLEAAVAAATDGSTVTLLKSTSGNGIIAPEGKFKTNGLTVDFGGFTYTVDGATVGSTGTETQAFQLLKDNKITFQNGTIYSEKALILVQNYSDLTLEGMTLTLNNAGYSSAYTLSNNNGSIVIDGSTINANPAGGFAFDVCRYSSYPSVNVTVKGESVINGDIEVYASGSDAKDGLGLTLEAGTFNGDIVLDATAKAILNATPEKAVITKDNTLTSVAAPADFKWVDNGDGTSTLAPCEYVAQIGDVKYESLAEAVEAVQDGETIVMIADVPSAGGISVPSGKNFTVDFDGHTYTLNKPGAGSTGTETSGFQLLMNSTITFKNGTINISEENLTAAVAPAKNIMRIIQNYANLTLDNMTIDGTNQYGGKDYVLSYNNGTSVIKDTKVIAGDDVIAFDVCRYSSYPSVNVTVQGTSEINGNIEVYAGGGDPSEGMYLTVEGGTINGELILSEGGATAITESPEKAIVKKNNDVDLDAPADFKWRDNNDGTSTLVPCEYICAIGTTKYETLAEAVAAAGTSAATITLLTEAATDGVISGNGVVVPSGSDITFDLNGLTYNVSGETVGSSTTETQGFQLLQGSTIKFQNGTLKATATTAQMLIQNYSNLTLTDVTLDGTGLSGWAYALSNNCGTINLTGSTSIIAKEGGRAFDTCKFGSYAIPTVNINTTGTISGPIEATGGKLNIEKGKFDVTWVTDANYAAGDIQITGGIYTAEVPEEYCAPGYICTDNEDDATKAQYPYTVKSMEDAGIFELYDLASKRDDKYPYLGASVMSDVKVNYHRTISSSNVDKFQAWFVPMDYTIKAEDLENFKFWKIHMVAGSRDPQGGAVDENNEDNLQIWIHIFSMDEGDVLKGNRPYVITPKVAGDFDFTEESTKIYPAEPEPTCHLKLATSYYIYNFYGTYEPYITSKARELIGLGGGKIRPNGSGDNLGIYRWYIKPTSNNYNDDYSNLRIGFVVDGEEDPTSIFAIEDAEGSDEISGIYSVNGTKYGTTMDDLQKGVNIIRYKNGTSKKILVK